jgi:hypothetical protein
MPLPRWSSLSHPDSHLQHVSDNVSVSLRAPQSSRAAYLDVTMLSLAPEMHRFLALSANPQPQFFAQFHTLKDRKFAEFRFRNVQKLGSREQMPLLHRSSRLLLSVPSSQGMKTAFNK